MNTSKFIGQSGRSEGVMAEPTIKHSARQAAGIIIPEAGVPARSTIKTAVSSSNLDALTPTVPSDRAMRTIRSVDTARVALDAPDQTRLTASASTLGAAPAATNVDTILAIIDALLANESRLKELAAFAEKSGNFVSTVGNAVLGIAGKAAELTKQLWSGSWLQKIGAIFTGLGAGLLYAVGGVLSGVGWVAQTVGSAFLKAFGRGQEQTTPPEDEIKALQEDNTKLNARLNQELEELKRESPKTHEAVLGEIARRRAERSNSPDAGA
jgi:hypothetical protein